MSNINDLSEIFCMRMPVQSGVDVQCTESHQNALHHGFVLAALALLSGPVREVVVLWEQSARQSGAKQVHIIILV